jgi:DNA-binding response OmpR family regulator
MVDGNVDAAVTIAEILHMPGHEVDVVDDGPAGFALYLTHKSCI